MCRLTVPLCCATQAFFDCLKADNSVPVVWYRGIRSKMERIIFTRQVRQIPDP